ncbi:DUF748 domain-containing protein [Adhaeribacter soli]|uniref:DUF748 domain-containing protein n=1 Tax=Adhaeribacter soli TaxID=2607655 RepID=A0A5N1JA50_9BACT|nr:DUF748 domain-containing protein [Adhaeribacter soli]KAA9345719.1 DUF748 domain-containing protein [Adhaeribacter soli]
MFKTLSNTTKILLTIVLLLVIFRLFLPTLVKHYVNKTLDELPGYTGYVTDVDIALYRGAYSLDSLYLIEEKGNKNYPFLRIKCTDLSIEWKSLFKGRLVGEVVLENPVINVVEGAAPAHEPTREHWTKTVKDLMPITINRLTVNNGRVAYMDFSASPDVKFHVQNLQLTAFNLANVEKVAKKLPASVVFSGTSIGGGKLKGDMQVNPLKKIPDLNLNASLTGVNLTSLNGFIKEYGKFDVEAGNMDMYTEMEITNGYLKGYFKPFFENVKVLNWKKDKEEGGVLSAAKEAVIGLLGRVLENKEKDKNNPDKKVGQIATVVPIEGNVNHPDTDNWKTFKNLLRNAFIKAFNKGIEGKIGGK